MELCVYQGSFNPIHNAHIRVAKYILEAESVDNVLFIPAFIPPHKVIDANLAEHRLNMLKLALENNPKFSVSDIEFKRKGVSYTYETILELTEQYSLSKPVKFIIGTDAFRKIETWYQADKLKNLVDFIVFVRDKYFDKSEFKYLKEQGYKFKLTSLPFEDISSSDIRYKISAGEYVGNLVPKVVEEYIKKYDLYKN